MVIVLGMPGLGCQAQNSIVGGPVSAKVHQEMRPTTFGRGLLIWLARFIICANIGFGLALMFGGMLAAMLMRH